jgi:hypothetical protein
MPRTGRLDHALLSRTVAARLSVAAEWHVNADEPASSGYRAGGPALGAVPTMTRCCSVSACAARADIPRHAA